MLELGLREETTMKAGSCLMIGLTLGVVLTNIALAQTAGGEPSRNAVGVQTPTSVGAAAATKTGPSVNGTAFIRPTARTGAVGSATKGAAGVLSGNSFAPKHP